jgi:catechol 2,3-dioxygenase-like lactoylglutathione lyase family enzyme
MLQSLSHIALVVRDTARTAALLHDLFDARVVQHEDEEGHLETYVRMGGVWVVLVAAPVTRTRTGDHIAFRATAEMLQATASKLERMGREFIWARSNTALYFFDDDDHVFELSTEDIDEELGG